MIIIIISQTTNFIPAFYGLSLLAAHSHSFQLFLKYLTKIIVGLSRIVIQSSNVPNFNFPSYFWLTKANILLILRAVNFEPLLCIPVKSCFSFHFLAPTACAVISVSEEVPIQVRHFK